MGSKGREGGLLNFTEINFKLSRWHFLCCWAKRAVHASQNHQTESSGDALPKCPSESAAGMQTVYHNNDLRSYYVQSKVLGVWRHSNNNNSTIWIIIEATITIHSTHLFGHCYFPRVAVTNGHKRDDLKQQKLILATFQRLEVRNQGVGRLLSSGGSEEESSPRPPWFLMALRQILGL